MFSRHASRDGQVGEQPGNGGSGDMIIVRYADDIVVGFQHEADARRFREAMRVMGGAPRDQVATALPGSRPEPSNRRDGAAPFSARPPKSSSWSNTRGRTG